jgi:hypothetical protein
LSLTVWLRLQRFWPDKEVTGMADLHPDVLWALMRERQRDLENELAIRARLRQARPTTAWRCRHALLAVRDCLRALGLRLQARQKPRLPTPQHSGACPRRPASGGAGERR